MPETKQLVMVVLMSETKRKDKDTLERIQRRATKTIPELEDLTYMKNE